MSSSSSATLEKTFNSAQKLAKNKKSSAAAASATVDFSIDAVIASVNENSNTINSVNENSNQSHSTNSNYLGFHHINENSNSNSQFSERSTSYNLGKINHVSSRKLSVVTYKTVVIKLKLTFLSTELYTNDKLIFA